MTQQDTAYRVDSTRVTWRETGEEAVLLDLQESVYFGLDRSGALLWRRLVGGATTEDLVDTLVGDGAVDRARARADVTAFLADLGRYGLTRAA
ncbi:PqqD family protein [Micromonospora humi]|uniref:Coenzyme PQQ synthesis protein D (PqqD) n=1 Tax=Micromonospora humi TaxID=745366 RepID=A0A1C5IIB8_9ACTN|nr:PqqD family protein [Micromonospora humi]SCG58107.1 Coenzyme PQQ synthesis protein D (PqqD) [Micromonospora humi]